MESTNPIGRANMTLTLVGLLLGVCGLLIVHAERDLKNVRETVLLERNRRTEAEDEAERYRDQADATLEELHRVKGTEPDAKPGQA